jgi:hypothetical protein
LLSSCSSYSPPFPACVEPHTPRSKISILSMPKISPKYTPRGGGQPAQMTKGYLSFGRRRVMIIKNLLRSSYVLSRIGYRRHEH